MKPKSVTSMRRHWDRFATRDPLFFACTNDSARDEQSFYASGLVAVEHALKWVGDNAPRGRLLEIGCGPGRTAIHFARQFDRVDAVDISAEMIRAVEQRDPPRNLHLHVCRGSDLTMFENDAFDVVYSALVFQHIPDRRIIDCYLREIERVLAPAGRAVLQFDTRPTTTSVRLAAILPDALLPRTRRRFIRRYRRDAGELCRAFQAAGLHLQDQRRPGTSEHTVMLSRSSPDPATRPR